MRKHIIGFALFTFIVTCGVMAYAFLYAPPMPQIEEVRIPVTISEPRTVEVRKEATALSYELKSFTVDLAKKQATIEVDLAWNSAEEPPAGLVFSFGVTTADRPFSGIPLGAQSLPMPFGQRRSISKRFILDLKGLGLSPKETAYYGYADATDIADSHSLTKTVYVEKNHMIGAIPALVRHPLKK